MHIPRIVRILLGTIRILRNNPTRASKSRALCSSGHHDEWAEPSGGQGADGADVEKLGHQVRRHPRSDGRERLPAKPSAEIQGRAGSLRAQVRSRETPRCVFLPGAWRESRFERAKALGSVNVALLVNGPPPRRKKRRERTRETRSHAAAGEMCAFKTSRRKEHKRGTWKKDASREKKKRRERRDQKNKTEGRERK